MDVQLCVLYFFINDTTLYILRLKGTLQMLFNNSLNDDCKFHLRIQNETFEAKKG